MHILELNLLCTFVGCKILTAVSINIMVFWDVKPYGLVGSYQRFKEIFCLHHQGDVVRFWNGLRSHDIRTKFREDRFRDLSNITVITATIWGAVMLVLVIEDGFMWHDIHTK
jgi:hypothetical protein